jgi:hypothetical protein
MKTPVFDQGGMILGYLDHDESLRSRPDFVLSAPVTVEQRRNAIPPFKPEENRARFAWGKIGASRTVGEVFYCDVLTTEASGPVLCRVRGFRFFAEEHGQRVVNENRNVLIGKDDHLG